MKRFFVVHFLLVLFVFSLIPTNVFGSTIITLGDVDNAQYDGVSSIDHVYYDPAWSATFPSSTVPRKAFDQGGYNEYVPFTFIFPTNEIVTNAWLQVSLGGATSNGLNTDIIALEEIDPWFTYSDLGWLPIPLVSGLPNHVIWHSASESEADEYRVATKILNLSNVLGTNLIPSLQDGQLNVLIADDSTVDFARLILVYQQTSQMRAALSPITTVGLSKYIGTVSDRIRSSQTDVAFGLNNSSMVAMAEPDDRTGDGSTFDVSPSGSMFAVGNGTNYFGDRRWGVWGRGYGVFGDRETTSQTPGYQYTTYGTSFGFDYSFTDHWLLGLTGGLSDGRVNYFSSRDESDIEGRHIGIYGSFNTSKWYFDSILTFTHLDYDTDRYVALTNEKLEGNFDGSSIGGYFEAGLNIFSKKRSLFQPLIAFQFANLKLDSYTETGGPSRLSYGSQSYQSYKGSLGLKWTKELYRREDGRNALFQLRGRWVHEFGDTESTVSANFADVPSAAFTISDDGISRDSFVLGRSFTAMLSKNLWLSVDYDTSFNSDDTAHLISLGLVFRK